MKWFKHDTTALHDAKIEKLIMKYGIQGYGLYFACVEIIAGNLSNENITFELEHDAEILAYKFKLDTLLVEEMMKYMCSLGLFETKNNKIYCYKLASRIDSSLIKNADLLKIKQQIQEDSRKVKKLQEKPSQIRLDQNRIDKIRKEKNSNKNKKYIPLAELLYKEHLKHDDKYLYGKQKEKTFNRWADDIRKIVEIDSRKYEEIKKIIKWIKNDEFWFKNIMSGSKLRKQFDRLYCNIKDIKQEPEIYEMQEIEKKLNAKNK